MENMISFNKDAWKGLLISPRRSSSGRQLFVQPLLSFSSDVLLVVFHDMLSQGPVIFQEFSIIFFNGKGILPGIFQDGFLPCLIRCKLLEMVRNGLSVLP